MEKKQSSASKRLGRPSIDPENRTQPIALRLTLAQRQKLLKLGGPAWVRERIDKARLPKE